jgi:hypothetical protein
MSEIEVCRLAHEGKLAELKAKLTDFAKSAYLKDIVRLFC